MFCSELPEHTLGSRRQWMERQTEHGAYHCAPEAVSHPEPINDGVGNQCLDRRDVKSSSAALMPYTTVFRTTSFRPRNAYSALSDCIGSTAAARRLGT
jgi:hypothetical protein